MFARGRGEVHEDVLAAVGRGGREVPVAQARAVHAEHLLAGGHEDLERADRGAQQPEIDGRGGA